MDAFEINDMLNVSVSFSGCRGKRKRQTRNSLSLRRDDPYQAAEASPAAQLEFYELDRDNLARIKVRFGRIRLKEMRKKLQNLFPTALGICCRSRYVIEWMNIQPVNVASILVRRQSFRGLARLLIFLFFKLCRRSRWLPRRRAACGALPRGGCCRWTMRRPSGAPTLQRLPMNIHKCSALCLCATVTVTTCTIPGAGGNWGAGQTACE